MVLGMSWAKPRSLGFSTTTPESTILDPRWSSERGRFVMQASADLAGGFPGYARRGARITGADLRLYQRAIVVDEGLAGGFALSIEAVLGVDADPLPSAGAPTVRVRYIDDHLSRLFTITVRPARASLRGGRPEVSLRQRLGELGFCRGPVEAVTTARYHVPFDETEGFADERVIWNGNASAPIHLGGDLDPVEVWITDRSLVWAHHRSGVVDRVPLEEVRDVASGHAGGRGHQAIAYVGVGLCGRDRVEVPFVFDTHATSAENSSERSRFVGALFSRGIANVQVNQPWQPWRVVATRAAVPPTTSAHWPEHVTPVGVSAALDEALRQAPATPADAPLANRVRQATSAADRLRPDRGVVIHGSDSYGYVYREPQHAAARPAPELPLAVAPSADIDDSAGEADAVEDELALALTVSPATDARAHATMEVASDADDILLTETADDTAATVEATAESARGAAERFEHAAIAAIKAAFEVIAARRLGDWTVVATALPASDADRAAALAEVIEQMAAGLVSVTSALVHKTRLEALADAASNLHRLLEEHAAGHVTIERLVAERIRIDSSLTRTLAAN